MNQFYKILLWAFVFALSSCRTEEVLYSSPIQGESYTAKSLWKEDEVFIKNVKKIYDENANPIRMYSEYGEVYWDYASSLNTFDERYLIAPIVKGNQVVAYMEARRKGGSVYFEFTKGDNKVNTFFNPLIFKDKHLKSVSPSDRVASLEEGMEVNGYPQRVLECKVITVTLIIGQVEGGPYDGEDITKTETRTVCKFVDGPQLPVDHCIGDYDQYGNCQVSGGGYGGGGYSYPNEEEEGIERDCDRIKRIGQNFKTKSLFKSLDSRKNDFVPGTSLYSEKGYILTEGTNGDIMETFIEGEAGKSEMRFNISQPIDGFMHSHYLGLLSVFSVSDLGSLAWMYKNGKIKNTETFVFGLVTASGTRYILTIEDPVKFNTFASSFLNSNNEFTDESKNFNEMLFYELYDIKISNNGSANENSFISYLEKASSGLKMMKSEDANFESWSVLKRNHNGKVIYVNCN